MVFKRRRSLTRCHKARSACGPLLEGFLITETVNSRAKIRLRFVCPPKRIDKRAQIAGVINRLRRLSLRLTPPDQRDANQPYANNDQRDGKRGLVGGHSQLNLLNQEDHSAFAATRINPAHQAVLKPIRRLVRSRKLNGFLRMVGPLYPPHFQRE
jgi:hypothetical protein